MITFYNFLFALNSAFRRLIFVDMCSFHSFPFTGAHLITLCIYNAICLPFLLLMDVWLPPAFITTSHAPVYPHAGASLHESYRDSALRAAEEQD